MLALQLPDGDLRFSAEQIVVHVKSRRGSPLGLRNLSSPTFRATWKPPYYSPRASCSHATIR